MLSDQDREALRIEFIANGLDSLHSWRCEHPDRYGPCGCVDEFVRDFLASDWLQRIVAQEKAAALTYYMENAQPHVVKQAVAAALREAAEDPNARLSGHSGVSVKWLRERADRIEGGS